MMTLYFLTLQVLYFPSKGLRLRRAERGIRNSMMERRVLAVHRVHFLITLLNTVLLAPSAQLPHRPSRSLPALLDKSTIIIMS